MTGHNQARNQGDHQVGNHIRAHVPNRVHNRVQGRRNSRLLAGTRLYWVLASASLRAKMQYKFDFVTSTIIQALMGTYDFFLVAVILWKFREVAGWDIYEIGLLFAVSRVGYGFYRVFCNELEQFEGYIVRGDFDSILIRPWPSLFVLLSRSVDLSRLTWVVQGAGIGAISLPHLIGTGRLTWGSLLPLLGAATCSGLLYFAVGLATASAAFWIVRIEELQVFTQNAPGTATLYPLDIYPGWLKVALLTVLPLGVGNYVPVVYLLGKGGTWVNLVWPVIISAVSLAVANRMWHAGEAMYHSTGS